MSEEDADEKYRAQLYKAIEKTGVDCAVTWTTKNYGQHKAVCIESVFEFLGGSIGKAEAHAIIEAIDSATRARLPVVAVLKSGGTRMQEGTNGFVQLAAITAAIRDHRAARLPLIVYLGNPCTGGAMATLGSAGTVTLAEPGALIGFLGPRAVEALTGALLPEGIQRAEHLFHHGIIDALIDEDALFFTVAKILDVLSPGGERDISGVHPPTQDVLTHVDHVLLHGHGLGGCRRVSPVTTIALARFGGHPCVVSKHNRAVQPPQGEHWLEPSDLRVTRRAIATAEALDIPFVSLIDTPAAEMSTYAEEHAMTGELQATLSAMLGCRTPTVAVILGEGCGAAALAMAAADTVLAATSSVIAPLAPEAAAAIIYRDSSRARDIVVEQKSTAPALLQAGLIEAVVDDSHPEEFPAHVIDAIATALEDASAGGSAARVAARAAKYRNLALL